LQALIAHLGLRDMVLVVHDFGGPIGLPYALEHPDRVKGLVLFNTWMWSFKGDATVERTMALMRGWFGQFIYTRLNFSPRLLLKAVMGDKTKLTSAIHQHYINPFAQPEQRYAPWMMATSLLGSSDWFDQLWEQRDQIADMPALILWGMRDPAFRERDLERWDALLRNAQTIRYPTAGHLVQEEEGPQLGPVVADFVGSMG
jgi:haloalkane dehalogenase